jgi:hypothetical protein
MCIIIVQFLNFQRPYFTVSLGLRKANTAS